MNHGEGADYGTHPEWTERVEPKVRKDYTPTHSPMLAVIGAMFCAAAILAAAVGLLVMTGVLR